MRLSARILKSLAAGLKGPKRAFDVWMARLSRVGEVDGIVISDLDPSLSKLSDSQFLPAVQEAMLLIREIDPRRHRRICSTIRFIVNRPMISFGLYESETRICSVDYGKHIANREREQGRRLLACVLVHEATHGLLRDLRIATNRKNWRRVEKICREEEMRFAYRVDPLWADRNIPDFDPKDWKLYKGSRRARWAAMQSRLAEMFRSLKWR